MSHTTPAGKQTSRRKVPITWGAPRRTTILGEPDGRTPRSTRGNEPAIDGADVSSVDNVSSAAAAAADSNTLKAVHLGGRTYVWPKRVVIVGYGVAKTGNRSPPQVTKLLERLTKECDWSNPWEVRLQDEMHVKKLHDNCAFFIQFSFIQLTIEGSDSDSHGWKPREADGEKFGRDCGLYQRTMAQVMSAQAGSDAGAPLQNGVMPGAPREEGVEAETGARGSGQTNPVGSEPGQEAGQGGGKSGGVAEQARSSPAAPTLAGNNVNEDGGRAEAPATGIIEQGFETRADIGGHATTSGGESAGRDSGLRGGALPRDGSGEVLAGDYHTPRSTRSFGASSAMDAESYAIAPETAIQAEVQRQLGGLLDKLQTMVVIRNLLVIHRGQLKGDQIRGETPSAHCGKSCSPVGQFHQLKYNLYHNLKRVKSNASALPLLPGPEGTNAGIVFQDWLAQVAVPMQDLSASSGTWWAGVLSLVREAYTTWLAATPLERLQLEPVGHEVWTSAKWTRVNSRACSLILQSLVEAIRLDLIARRAVQSAPLMLFRLHTCYQPGGANERSAVLGSLQSPTAPTSVDEALTWLRSWPRKDLNMMVPDGTILARALTMVTTKFVADNADTHFRTQLLRSSLRIDGQPKIADVIKYHQHLQAEIESMIAARFDFTFNYITNERAKGHKLGAGGRNISRATHALRRSLSQEEWEEAEPVTVNLAGGESIGLRMNAAGTILVPINSRTSAMSTAPIVPLGALINQLGYTMTWGKTKCKLEGKNGEVMVLRVREGCPEVTEQEALKLISELEDVRLQELRENTRDTRSRVKAAALAMERTWFDYLISYIDGGISSQALKAVESAPFLQEVPRECKAGLVDAVPEANGWQALKGLERLNRKTRKRLWTSNKWLVHLYAGQRERRDLQHLEGHGYTILELDIERGRTHDVLRSSTWRALEWGARMGKIGAIIGGPPQSTFMISRHVVGGPEPVRSNEYLFGNWPGQSDSDVFKVNRETQLITRMVYLHALATAGRTRANYDPTVSREVAFLLEHPRDPRGYLKFQDPLYPDVVSLWRTSLWSEYALEAGLHAYNFDMAALGKAYTRHTTIGTNLHLRHLDGLRLRWHSDGPAPERAPACVWPQEFYEHLVIMTRDIALRDWGKIPRMLKMSAEQRRDHVRRGHLPFRADCSVCVQAGGMGRRHSRVEHPSAFVLSADLSGVVKVGGVDPDGRGAFPRPFKYIFAAKLRVPKSFVEDGRGVWLDYDPGEVSKEDYEEQDDGLAPVEGGVGDRVPEDPAADGGEDCEPELKEVPRRDPDEDSDLGGPELVNLIFACGLKDDKVFDEAEFRQRAETLEQNWSLDVAENLVRDVARLLPDDERVYGMFRHGGRIGVTKSTVERPWFARVLNRVMLERAPDAEYAAVFVSINNEREVHIDRNNALGAMNHLLPISMPRRGGELWMELRDSDVVSGKVIELETIPTSDGDYLFKCDWSMAAKPVRDHGSLVPPGDGQQCEHTVACEEQWEDWEMHLVLDDANEPVSTAALSSSRSVNPSLKKAEVTYTDGIEEILANLSSPVSVVYTVNPKDVLAVFEKWIPSLNKEVNTLDHAVEKVMGDDSQVRDDLNSGRGQLIPMKVVYTIKPPDPPTEEEVPAELFKRKSRIVICGNMATHSPSEVFASTAPAEVVRAAIALARFFNWNLGAIDIVAAFLQTPLRAVKGAPLVYGVPPKVLVRAGLAKPGELWKLTHAVYGLQESPKLWGAYRDTLLAQIQLVFDGKRVTLMQGRVEPSWWSVLQDGSVLIGILVVYVDDLLLCGRTELIKELAAAIKAVWKTSPLQLATDGEIRFLGIEISLTSQGFALSQRAYIEELLRIHEMTPKRKDLVPVAKELASFVAAEDEAPANEAEIRAAQQIAGELLWISQRTRPDIAFVCSLVGSLATRAPRRAVEIGEKTLGYLQRTIGRQLLYEGGVPYLTGFVDASFAPDASRSHTGWIVLLAGNVIAWRSSRQSCISLSTAEAELEAAVEGLVALQGVQALLHDIGVTSLQLQMHSDSTSALAIARGSCSWRTRHLRLKSSWIGELIAKGTVEFNHCSGEVQPADLLTKPLSSARMRALSGLIGLIEDPRLPGGGDQEEVQGEVRTSIPSSSSSTHTPSPIPKVLVALLVLAQAFSGERATDEYGMVAYGSSVSVDYGLLTWMLLWLLVLLAVMSSEALKWIAWVVYDRASPGASARRLRRLQRLRDATSEAIQKEVAVRIGTGPERRARDARRTPAQQQALQAGEEARGLRSDPQRSQDPNAEERMNLLRRLARGTKEQVDAAVQTAAFSPVQAPGTRVILRYVHEPPEQVFVVPDNECFHVYEDCYAFRHRGTQDRVQRRRLCQFCSNRAAEDPDKTPDYGRDLERAHEYERVFNTTLRVSGQSSHVPSA
ncbi:unnamed protein product [Symbiodinium sp. CCMP2592]|nr:unnamed protein product [Symbiodinium sp. CCMP2592]